MGGVIRQLKYFSAPTSSLKAVPNGVEVGNYTSIIDNDLMERWCNFVQDLFHSGLQNNIKAQAWKEKKIRS